MEQTFRHGVEHILHITGDYSGFLSDDFFLSKYAMNDLLVQKRAAFIRRYDRDAHKFSAGMYQRLPCIELKKLDRQMCPSAPASGCIWLRSVDPIPVPIITQSVSDTLGVSKFDYVAWERAASIGQSRIRSARTARYYTLLNNGRGEVYLYIYNDSLLPQVAMSGIFEDPQHAEVFCSCTGEHTQAKCFPLDVPMYLDPAYQDEVYKMVMREMWPYKMQAPEDRTNNDQMAREAVRNG